MSAEGTYLACAGAIIAFVGGFGTWSAIAAHKEKNAGKRPPSPDSTRFEVRLGREADGQWIAGVPSLPGVLAYGATRDAALAAVESLALRVLADRIEHGEMAPGRLELTVPATA
jgi:predicted RNase H-like HicB family nuclease